MGLLIDRINVREKAKYEQNTIKVLNNVVKPITTREYLVPNNAKSSAVYFWQNVLLIPPVRDGHTFPLTFIPSDNQNIIVKARFSHHPSGPLDNWTKYEAMGSPNKRVDIYFFGADDSDDPNGDVEAHVISNKHLYSDSDVKLLQQALANFFKSGNFVNPFCENNENNNTKQINCNTNMNKKLIRLTESDLHRIVKESVKKVLKEGVFDSKRIQAELDNSLGGGAMVADFHSSDDMVTIIAQPNAVDSHELDTVMNELGYMYYRMQPKAYDAYLFIHKDSLGKYYDDETTNRLKMEHGFDY